MKIKLSLLVILAILGSLYSPAQTTASSLFLKVPSSTVFFVDSLTALDMLDYYRSGSPRHSQTIIGGKAVVRDEQPMKLSLTLGESVDYDIMLLPASRDTIVAVIETLYSSIPDSRISFYSRDWKPLGKQDKLFTEPALNAWLTEAGMQHSDKVEEMLPFVMWRAEYNPESSTLTLTYSMDDYFVDEDRQKLEPYLCRQIEYIWNGKRFTPKAKTK